jgi:pyridoxal phosphate enzyme (YggS family)
MMLQILCRLQNSFPMTVPSPSIADLESRLRHTEQALAHAAAAWNRPAPRLVAVSKTQPVEKIESLLRARHRCFGENRVQEAAAKWPALRRQYPDIELHLIGPLQTNKARQAVQLFDVIETLDRPRLAATLAMLQAEGLRLPRLFIQVNTGEEPQKAGIAPQDADAFINHCRTLLNLPIVGLMAIPPVDQPPAPHFALLARLAARHDLPELSMGMSGDWETAVALGATQVRLGTVLFGERVMVTAMM